MAKLDFKPGNMLFPLPAVLVSVRDRQGNDMMKGLSDKGDGQNDQELLKIFHRGHLNRSIPSIDASSS